MNLIVKSGQENLSDTFPIQSGLKEGDATLPLPFNFALEYATRKVKANQDRLN